MRCPIHQKRPSGTHARLFVMTKSCCWVCRDDLRWTKACAWCCKSMCPKCWLFEEVRNGVPFTCNGCCLTREEQTAPILLQLLTLVLNCTCVTCTAPENFRLDTLAVRNHSEKVEEAHTIFQLCARRMACWISRDLTSIPCCID